jgi:hypothetical protein
MKDELLYYWEYCEKVNRDNWSSLPIKNKLKAGFDEGGIFYTDEEIFIAIDGSNDPNEWFSNFKYCSNKLGFHHNFYEIANIFYSEVKPLLDNRKITVIGHSRGGAIALILSYLINRSDLKVITFGSPKVATLKGFLKLKNSKINHFRVTVKNDFIPTVPPFILGFIHYQTSKLTLPKVKGKFNHLAFRQALENYYSRKGK